MKSDDFIQKYPGLSRNQINFKYEIWKREKERERFILESLKNKKIPFSYKDGDQDTGDFSFILGGFSFGSGVVSDAPLSGAIITFVYPDGSTKNTYSDPKGRFDLPHDFSYGDIISNGGIDIVTGLEYKGELKIDAEFFLSYNSITPLTHIANNIWLNTPTVHPHQVLEIVVNFLPKAFGLTLDNHNFLRILNDDPVRLTIEGFPGAKEIQALNTLIEIHSDLIGSTEANHQFEISHKKNKAIDRISDAILVDLRGQSSKNYFEDVFSFHDIEVQDRHKDCCKHLLDQASSIITDCLTLEDREATIKMQTLNYAVKSSWIDKALVMTQDKKASAEKVWDSIGKKDINNLMDQISINNL